MFKSLALNFNLPSHSDEFSYPPIQLSLHGVLHGTAGWPSRAAAAFKAFRNAEWARLRGHTGERTPMGKLVRKLIFLYFLDK